MWSDKYYYLNIYKNESLSRLTNTKSLTDFIISNIGKLRHKSNGEFENDPNFPFCTVNLLNPRNLKSYSDKDFDYEETSLIVIVCTKKSDFKYEDLMKPFIEIAKYLNWNLVNEDTDDGTENYVIWKPKE